MADDVHRQLHRGLSVQNRYDGAYETQSMMYHVLTFAFASVVWVGCGGPNNPIRPQPANGAQIQEADSPAPATLPSGESTGSDADRSEQNRAPVLSTPPPDNVIDFTPANVPHPCPGLAGSLSALLNAENPASFAGENGLHLTDEGVGVNIRLVSPDRLPAPHSMSVRNVFGPNIEAYVPLDQLCAVAADEAVLNVSPLIRLGIP